MPHQVHIIQLIATIEKPSPRLILEYLPLGNLEVQHQQRNISDDEVLTILHQSLSALTYLHEQTPSVVHQDIKPQNMLVQSRDPLHIKLADFGLSRASDYLSTLCGTQTYLAPEIARYWGSNGPQVVEYVKAVDIWSLGVVAFEYAYGLPDRANDIGLPWCEKIIGALEDWDSDDLTVLLSTMIVMDPNMREPARKCLHRAAQLRAPGRSSTPTPAAGGPRQGQNKDDNGSTTIILRNLWGQDSVGIKRQRSPAIGSANDSSSRGWTKRRRSGSCHADDVSERYRESDRFGNLYNAILKLFEDLKVDANLELDDRTHTLIERLCEDFRRLDITMVRVIKWNISGQATVSAGADGEEFVLATLTPSEQLCPPAELATHLLNMLRFHSSHQRSEAMVPLNDTASYRTQESKNPSSWAAESIESESNDSDQQLGITCFSMFFITPILRVLHKDRLA